MLLLLFSLQCYCNKTSLVSFSQFKITSSNTVRTSSTTSPKKVASRAKLFHIEKMKYYDIVQNSEQKLDCTTTFLEVEMTTQIKTLNAEAWDVLHQNCLAIYLDGECYAFATALHEGLGWPMVGVMQDGIIRHVAVRDPKGVLHDVRGSVSDREFGEPFNITPPYNLKRVDAADLVRTGEPAEVRARSVAMARRWAEKLWPELPWIDSEAMRTTAFCDELEKLCRKHGLWIRAPYPAGRPVLAIGEGDEKGFTIYPMDDGFGFTIERRLA